MKGDVSLDWQDIANYRSVASAEGPVGSSTGTSPSNLLVIPGAKVPPNGTIIDAVPGWGAAIVAVQVAVSGDAVTASLCFTQDDPMDFSDIRSCTYDAGGKPQWDTFVGTRNGAAARVREPGSTDEFFWGTVSFASSDPSAPAIAFTGAQNCEKFDGGYGLASYDSEPICTEG